MGGLQLFLQSVLQTKVNTQPPGLLLQARKELGWGG